MQIKHALGKLPLPGQADQLGATWMKPLGAELLPIELRHLGKLYDLKPVHRDLFDRILIAQALNDGMTLVTADLSFKAYDVSVIW